MFVTGLQHILGKIPKTKPVHLDAALELVRHPFASAVVYPFRASKKKTPDPEKRAEEEPEQSTSGTTRKRPHPEGIFNVADDPKCRKYGNNLPENLKNAILKFIKSDKYFSANPELGEQAVTLVAGSLAKRTWSKYSSALAKWENFLVCTQGGNPIPFNSSTKLLFSCWCYKRSPLAPATVKVYLSALEKISFLTSVKKRGGGSNAVLQKLIFRGMENLNDQNREEKPNTNPVSLKALDEIRGGLQRDSCTRCTRKSIWALALSAYWGLIRLGEILPKKAETFDKTTDLLWENVQIDEEKAVLTLKFPKVRNKISRSVVLYKVSDSRFCPVGALSDLRKALQKAGLWQNQGPVFIRSSGKALTKNSFLEGVNRILRAKRGDRKFLSGKSFRSGIPSELGEFPEELSTKRLKALGRWKGPSFLRYIRNPEPQNRWIYKKVSDFLLQNFLCR